MKPDVEDRARTREVGLRAQGRITRRVFALGAGACAVFAGLAAVSKATNTTPSTAKLHRQAAVARSQPATNVKAEDNDDEATIAPPATPVTATPVAPVTSSGGS
jgi:hypothetical protein